MMRTKTTEPPGLTTAERLTAAEGRHDQVVARLEAARIALEELRATHAKTREGYLAAGASAELEDGERPSRATLTELERQLPDAEDTVTILERAAAEAARAVRHAKANVVDEQATAMREETARRQARIDELQPQLAAIQQEIHEHSRWIGNEGPVKISQLAAEAQRLRSEPA